MIINPLTGCSPAAMRVYLVHADNPSATFPEIAEGLGVSLRTVQRAVKELESVGLVMRERRVTDYGVPMPSGLAPGDRDSSVVMAETYRDSSVVCDRSCQGGDRDSSVAVNGRYVVSSKQIGLSEEVLRTSSSRAAQPPSDQEPLMGYDFFEQHTPDEDDLPTRRKRTRPTTQRPAQSRSKSGSVDRDWTDRSKWTSMDVAQHWRSAVAAKHPLKVSSTGPIREMGQIFAKRAIDYGETPEVQARLIDKFLADPRNVTQAGKGVAMKNLLLGFMNRNADGAREDLKRAEDTAEVEAIEAAMAAGEVVEPRVVDKKWGMLADLMAEVDPS